MRSVSAASGARHQVVGTPVGRNKRSALRRLSAEMVQYASLLHPTRLGLTALR
jgi:hypothetical protein